VLLNVQGSARNRYEVVAALSGLSMSDLDIFRDFEILEDARAHMHGDPLVGGPIISGIRPDAAYRQMIADLWPMAIDNTIGAIGAAVVADMIARMETGE
jgi:hypothetical protein